MPYIYVASSWRNPYHAAVVGAFKGREAQRQGFTVYDFTEDGASFKWQDVFPDWTPGETISYAAYIIGLGTDLAEAGYCRDMDALEACDICILVLPAGRSANLEAGWAVGAGKRVYVYTPQPQEPDLMYKMCDGITDNFMDLLSLCGVED